MTFHPDLLVTDDNNDDRMDLVRRSNIVDVHDRRLDDSSGYKADVATATADELCETPRSVCHGY